MTDFSKELAHLRQDYRKDQLDVSDVGDNPLSFFKKWFAEAQDSGELEANAMSIATVDEFQKPHVRTVLLKGLDDAGFIFFTNYKSHKGLQISKNNNVALLFFWSNLERQVRIEGMAEKIDDEVSAVYFDLRPEGSRISAIASPQSEKIPDRSWIEKRYAALVEKYKTEPIIKPEHWGGFIVKPVYIEFWQGRSSRLHDRIAFKLKNECWEKFRLAP